MHGESDQERDLFVHVMKDVLGPLDEVISVKLRSV